MGKHAGLFHFTVDVDYTPGTSDGVERLLDFCASHQIRGSYFVAGMFAEQYPAQVRRIAEAGHELGTHGWLHDHDPDENFWTPTVDEQLALIEKATRSVYEASGTQPVMFRAPNLRVNESTLSALRQLGYRLDSSVPARRLSLTYQRRVPRQFFAPQRAYSPSDENVARDKQHADGLIEVPPSSFLLPFSMSAIRLFGLKRLILVADACVRRTGFLNFYIHPVEVTDPTLVAPRPHEPKRYREGLGPQHLQTLEQLVAWTRAERLRPEPLSYHLR